MRVRAIELTARQTKTQPGFKDLGDFNFQAFIKNNAPELVATMILSPACQQPSFFKHFLRNTIKKILIKENGRQLSWALKPLSIGSCRDYLDSKDNNFAKGS